MTIINSLGLELIKSFEDCRLEPYQDVRGIWSVGFGHTEGVTSDSAEITQDQADDFLMHDLGMAEHYIEKAIESVLNENQFSALVSLVYNCGPDPLYGHIGTYLNSQKYDQAADYFLQWNHCNSVVIPGLTRRRTAERELFLTPVAT